MDTEKFCELLVGELDPIPLSLLGITGKIDVKKSILFVDAYFSEASIEEDLDEVSYALTRVVSHFPAQYTMEDRFLIVKNVTEMEKLDFWAFNRHPAS